jgi:hypothetical protein
VASRLAIVLTVLLGVLAAPSRAAQAPIDVYDLADYRLTPQVFEQFVQASRLIAEATRRDPAFTYAPLFTKEIALSGDAPAMAAGLVARLENHAQLAASLQTAKLTAREYAKFAIALVGAHLAHGFLDSGVLRRVPDGAPTANVAFVDAHEAEITSALETLGISD